MGWMPGSFNDGVVVAPLVSAARDIITVSSLLDFHCMPCSVHTVVAKCDLSAGIGPLIVNSILWHLIALTNRPDCSQETFVTKILDKNQFSLAFIENLWTAESNCVPILQAAMDIFGKISL